MLRTILVIATLAFLTTLGAATASADSYTVGDCSKSGACVNACLSDGDTSCYRDSAVCVGASYQIPFCIPKQR